MKAKVQRRNPRKRALTWQWLLLAIVSGALTYAYRNDVLGFKKWVNSYFIGFLEEGRNPLELELPDDFHTQNQAQNLPKYKGKGSVIAHNYYTICYNEEHEQPVWVAYTLSRKNLEGDAQRTEDFRPDPKVLTGSAFPLDYRSTGYDKGHLAPAGDFHFSQKAMSETFFMSNMSPQKPDFNRGIWEKLESTVRKWARREEGKLHIVTGPVLHGGNFRKIGKRAKISVPEYYYKIIMDLEPPEVKAIAFLMRNEGSQRTLETFVVTIDEVEKKTGIDFFPDLPDKVENDLEAHLTPELWF